MDVHLLHKQGCSIREIVRKTGYSRNTVRKMLRDGDPPTFAAVARACGVDAHVEYIDKRFNECGLSAVRLLEELRPMGFAGSIHMIRRRLAKLRPRRRALVQATLRFETPAGQQAQADWAYCGRFATPAGGEIAVYVFVIQLSFSRTLFVRFTTSMELGELIRCHQRAFDFFGGVPASILYDNMKQVRLSQQQWNPQFADFAVHHGFAAKTCRIRRPRTKGKIERMVDYVKDNFLNGRSFADLDDLNAQAMHWLAHTANVRVHATTNRRPVDLLAEELPHLTPLSQIRPYRFIEPLPRKVSSESTVRVAGSRYSVPPAYVGQEVIVRNDHGRITVHAGDLVIAEHQAASRPGACVMQKEHLEELWKLAAARPAEPAPNWQLTFEQTVASVPLSLYEQATDGCQKEVAA
jgi:transposase